MYCPICNKEIAEPRDNCPTCGSRLLQAPLPPGWQYDPALPEGIFIDENGAYRWSYFLDMKRDKSMLRIAVWVIAGICIGLCALLTFMMARRGSLSDALKFCGIIVGCCAFAALIAWLVYLYMAHTNGGLHQMDFAMDNEKVTYLMPSAQRRRAANIEAAGALVSLLTGANTYPSTPTRVDSFYTAVRSVKPMPQKDYISVNNIFQHNRIYCTKAQYDFVLNYITPRCTRLGEK